MTSLHWNAPSDDPTLVPVTARYRDYLITLPGQLRLFGEKLLGEISTTNWFVEWNLPRWLGRELALSNDVIDNLILANVYGLSYVRLQDNLFDSEQGSEWQESNALVIFFYRLWIGQYRRLFDNFSPFWEHLDRYTGQWLRASLEKGGPGGAELRSGLAQPILRLAERGAPLKICCAAVYLLSGQELVDTRLLDCISYLLAGAVLVDHADDWQDDLSAGRYNALAAFLSDGSDDPQANRQAILEELYLGSAAKSYFELAQQQFRQARDCVNGLGFNELVAYLEWAEEETRTHQERLSNMLKSQLQIATAALLRTA